MDGEEEEEGVWFPDTGGGDSTATVLYILPFHVVRGGGSFERGISNRERAGAFEARSGIHAAWMEELDGHCSAD